MADVAITILQVVAEVRTVAKDIKDNDRQARRLLNRVTTIEPAVLAVKHGKKRLPSESLLQLLETVGKIRKFLDVYARTAILNRVWKRKSHAATFRDLGDDLAEGRQALQLDVVVDTWAKEDASDRLEDIENLKDEMKREERHSTDNRAQFSRAVKALEKDERSELTAWVEINFDEDLNFEGSILLGSGGFGEVKTAKWNGSDVAVKHLRADNLRRDLIRALRKETRIHSSLHFDHVVQLYAASTIAPNLCMVMEYSSEGSLWQYLHSTRKPLAHALQAAFAFDIARGMSFLHKKGILHRDLKSANVLVFANRRLKLCDFGLSKIKAESSSRSANGSVGTANWTSPEEMDGGATSELTDVYSFGVVCFEVATRVEPFQGMRPAQVIGAVLYKEQRPSIPEWASASPDILPLMGRCWKQDPAQRPEGFVPVVKDLSRVVERVGDPRNHRSAANDVTSPPGVKHSGGAASVAASTAPTTASDSLGATPLPRTAVKAPTAASAPAPENRLQRLAANGNTSPPGGKSNGGDAASVAASTTPTTVSDSLGATPLPRTAVKAPTAASAPAQENSAQDASTDRAALMALYVATDSPPEKSGFFNVKRGGWNRRKCWGTSAPLGEWFGVKVEGNRVVKLDLQITNLIGSIPAHLSALTALTWLDLSGNKLTGAIPVELGRLTALQTLDLNNNRLRGPIPTALGGLTALQNLRLDRNKLSGSIPPELGRLTALWQLALYDNQLSGSIPPSLGGLKSLTYLGLHFNHLTGAIPVELGRLTALKTLSLSGNFELVSGGKAHLRRMLPNCTTIEI